jgi:gliding motility-associated-like protein
MKSSSFLILICLVSFNFFAAAQGNQNKKPHIVGQDPLVVNEDQSLTILMTHLTVQDPDDWFYPWGFTMTIYPGENYSVSGHVVTPAPDFNGKLSVQVTVHDGLDESNRYNLAITVNPVNDRPMITGHNPLSTNEDQAIAVQLSHLKVTDPDNKYPDDFTLNLRAGSNYSVEGNRVAPQAGFSGTLSVNVTVNDGQLESEPYVLPIEVKPVDRVPEITGQVTLQVNEDESIAIQLTHLTVVDQDSNYPQDFTLTLLPGENYAVSNSTVTPSADFSGKLTVRVTVSDGMNTSKPFNLAISVTPANDIPRIENLETEPIFYGYADASVPLSQTLTVSEVDGDSIMFAEVGIRAEAYIATIDKLIYTPPANSTIRGVFDANTGVLTLLGQASPAAYTAALRSVHFQTMAPSTGARKVLYIVANDGKSGSEASERLLLFGQAAVSLDIPTGFTPNGDTWNDTWKIVPLKSEEEFSGARIRVFNKAGVLVYESVGLQSEWDGRLNGELLPADTYFYTIDLNINAPEGYLRGLVTILR